MLELTKLEGGYGETLVLLGVDLHVKEGTVHGLSVRNGVGKFRLILTQNHLGRMVQFNRPTH